MKVFELAKKLNRTSKEILSASYQLQIKVKSHLSNLTDDEVNKIIKYFRKKRILFFFNKYLTVFVGVFILTVIFTIMNSQTVASGQIYASVDEQGELTLDWSFESTVEEGVILVESESELLIIEVDENNGIITECCFLEDLEILLLFTDDDDDIVEVESVNISLPNTNISSTTTTILQTTSTSTSTTIAECNDDEFVPYTLYDSEGNANTVLTCRNEQDAIDSGYTYTTNPKPVTTTLAPTTTSTSTTTTLAPTTTSTSTTTTLAPTTTSTSTT
ncbi:MAG: translation initiation factor IF-2 N-terminal domain-containing protein, partial [Candidatus Actinomarina sp.]